MTGDIARHGTPPERDVWKQLFYAASGERDGAVEIKGVWYWRQDVIIEAMRSTVGEIAGKLDASGTPHAPYELIRALELGEARAPEQLQAALIIRLLQPLDHPQDQTLRRLDFMRCVLDVHRDGQISSHFKAMSISPKEVPELLRKAIWALQEELDTALKTRTHGERPIQPQEPSR